MYAITNKRNIYTNIFINKKPDNKSVLVNDEPVKVNLSIYDTNRLEGLYVPKSSFSETANDIVCGTVSQDTNINDGSSEQHLQRW